MPSFKAAINLSPGGTALRSLNCLTTVPVFSQPIARLVSEAIHPTDVLLLHLWADTGLSLTDSLCKGVFAISLTRYLELLDWVGRQVRGNKKGAIPAGLGAILKRIGLSAAGLLSGKTQERGQTTTVSVIVMARARQ